VVGRLETAHDWLDDAAYALVVGAIDADAAQSEESRSHIPEYVGLD